MLEGEDVFATTASPERLLLALGSEAHGISDEVFALAARLVTVPQTGRVESLNVAMAGCVVLSWLGRLRASS